MKVRLAIVVVVFGLWSAGLAARLVQLQVSRHDEFLTRAQRQQSGEVDLEPPRGTIFDREGRELAVSVEVASAYAVPRDIKDPAVAARALADILGLKREALEERLRGDGAFVWVARKLDRPQAEEVRALGLEGIGFVEESKRYYPMRGLAGQVLGFVGTDHWGLSGLEARYDRIVAGTGARQLVLRDAHQRRLLSPRFAYVDAEAGQDLELTLDSTVQFLVERELRAVHEKYGALKATAVIMDPRTGAILAMHTEPGFDPNRFAQYPEDRWKIGAIADLYEPGSTFKVITMSAALESRVVKAETLLDCEMGAIELGGVIIHDHKKFGWLTAAEVLANSSNVGAIKLALLVGDEPLYQTMRGFGIGEVSGVDLPGESAGLLQPREGWRPLSKAYMAFGQEVAVTALQMARAVSAIANGGRLVRPHVTVLPAPGDSLTETEVIRAETARTVASMMEKVVRDGTGKAAAIPGYRVAGKTGTAQKSVDGRYSSTRFVANFVGFAPLEDPRIVCVVAVEEPKGAIHGGVVAAPVFKAIVEPVLHYLGVPPSEAGPRPVLVAQTPAAPEEPQPTEPIPVDGAPRFLGMSAREALRHAEARGLLAHIEGQGWVVRQEPLPGGPVEANEVRLILGTGVGAS